jgi:hypothetical protein
MLCSETSSRVSTDLRITDRELTVLTRDFDDRTGQHLGAVQRFETLAVEIAYHDVRAQDLRQFIDVLLC